MIVMMIISTMTAAEPEPASEAGTLTRSVTVTTSAARARPTVLQYNSVAHRGAGPAAAQSAAAGGAAVIARCLQPVHGSLATYHWQRNLN